MMRSARLATLTLAAWSVSALGLCSLALADIPPTDYDRGYDAGYRFGQTFGPLLCLCCFAFIGLIVAAGIFFVVRKKKNDQNQG